MADERRFTSIVFGNTHDGNLSAILGAADSPPCLLWQDLLSGSWHWHGPLQTIPASSVAAGPGDLGELQVLSLGRDDGIPYLVWEDHYVGRWHWAGPRRFGDAFLPFVSLAAGVGDCQDLQILCIGKDGIPYLFWQKHSDGGWHAGHALAHDKSVHFAQVAFGGGYPGDLFAVLLNRNGHPFSIRQDKKSGHWYEPITRVPDPVGGTRFGAVSAGHAYGEDVYFVLLERGRVGSAPSGCAYILSYRGSAWHWDRLGDGTKSFIAGTMTRTDEGVLHVVLLAKDGTPWWSAMDTSGQWAPMVLLPHDGHAFNAVAAAPGHAGNLQVVCIGDEDRAPYLIWQYRPSGEWVWGRALPTREGPGRSSGFGISPAKFTTGDRPNCALAALNQRGGAGVVEVHTRDSRLWSLAGSLEGITPTWGPERGVQRAGEIADGSGGAIALVGDGSVLLAYEDRSHALRFCTGKLDHSKSDAKQWQVLWDADDHADWISRGSRPALAVRSGQLGHDVILVYQSQPGVNAQLRWRYGKLIGGVWHWLAYGELPGAQGQDPAVAVTAEGVAVVAYTAPGDFLRYTPGRVSDQPAPVGSLSFATPVTYARGIRPSVGMTPDGILELHEHNYGLYQRKGYVNPAGYIQWLDALGCGESAQFDRGADPCLACDGHRALHVHKSSVGLHATGSFVLDRSLWMEELLSDALSLSDISFPGSHDASMYPPFEKGRRPWDDSNTGEPPRQELDVYGQLRAGSRYFDIRIAWWRDAFHTIHGGQYGPQLRTLLVDLRRFLEQSPAEIAIFNIGLYEMKDHESKARSDPQLFARLCYELHDMAEDLLGQPTLGGAKVTHEPLGVLRQRQVKLIAAFEQYEDNRIPSDLRPVLQVSKDWRDKDVTPDDLVSYDSYKGCKAEHFSSMATFQRDEFLQFDGYTVNDTMVDLTFIEWGLRGGSGADRRFGDSGEANAALADWTERKTCSSPYSECIPWKNPYQVMVNVLYTDYIDDGRALDLSLLRSGHC